MNILIIEDDPRIAQNLQKYLNSVSYQTVICSSVDEVETLLLQNLSFEFAIIDRMLGDFEGASLIAPLRKSFPQIGIIILSSLENPVEKAHWLDMGADDYMGKPFSLEELTARIRKIMRLKLHQTSTKAHFHVFHNTQIDLIHQHCRVEGKTIDLTRKELQILIYLIEKPGRVLSKNQIIDRVWNMENTTESNVVEVTIKNLRRKLHDGHSQLIINSKRNLGYWIEE